MSDSNSHRPKRAISDWLIGKLLAHGEAPYQFEPENSPSYYVRLLVRETEAGARARAEYQDRGRAPIDGREEALPVTRESGGRLTLWGKDLGSAIKRSKSHVQKDDEVAIRVVGSQPTFDRAGKYLEGRDKKIYEVERLTHVNGRLTNARRLAADYREGLQLISNDPEARAIFWIRSQAEKLATLRFPNDPESRKRFIEGVDHAIAQPDGREQLIAAAVRRVQGDQQPKAARPPQLPTAESSTKERSGWTRE
jgi:hypothetical protein